jgi:DNA repair exonuclease SbcCD nuclease subunit
MKILGVGDLHLSVTPPGRRAEGYLDELLDMLAESVTIANNYDAVMVLAGDIFHHKRWSRVPHWLVQTVGDQLAQCLNHVIIVPGNHDLADGTMLSLDRQPLSLLDWVPNVFILRDSNPHAVGNRAHTESVVVVGIPGTADVTEARDETRTLYATYCDLLVAHAPISMRPLPWPTFTPDELGLNCKLFMYGHQHDKVQCIGTQTVALGCLARGAINEADHTPSVVLIDINAERVNSVDIIPLQSARPASEIYRWAERAAEQAENDAMHSFVASLGEATLAGFSRESLIQTLWGRQDLPEPVRRMAVEILEEAGS